MKTENSDYKKSKKIKKIKSSKSNIGSNKDNRFWVFLITIIAFFISLIVITITESMLKGVTILFAIIIVFIIIVVGVLFDIIGVAVTAADIIPLNALAAKKYYGAKRAILLIQNANKVSNFCNDVIGDICGIISGSAGILVAISFADSPVQQAVYASVVSAIIAALTIGGKALGKTIGIRKCNIIVYKVGAVLETFSISYKKKRGKISEGRNKIKREY